MTVPALLPRPGVWSAVGARREDERRLLGEIRDKQLWRVLDDDDRRREPGAVAPDLSMDDLKVIVIALRKAAHTSHPEMARRERDLAHRIAQHIPPPFTPEEVS